MQWPAKNQKILLLPSMKNLPVIASVNSRLQADIALIRLRRANISCRAISVLFPNHSMPNAVGCWLPVADKAALRVGQENIACAGHFRKQLADAPKAHEDGREVSDLLTHAGVDAMGAHILAERLGQGHILLCVHARNEEETSIAWHVFRHACADTIIVGAEPRVRSAQPQRRIPLLAPWLSYAAA
jgi:hypothetical protein